jgi:acetyl-CoA acyltransferase
VSDALIIDAVRSPIGKRDGALSTIRGDELAAQVLNGLVERNDLDPAEVEDVQMGCVTQIGEQGWNIGRMAPLVARDRGVSRASCAGGYGVGIGIRRDR